MGIIMYHILISPSRYQPDGTCNLSGLMVMSSPIPFVVKSTWEACSSEHVWTAPASPGRSWRTPAWFCNQQTTLPRSRVSAHA